MKWHTCCGFTSRIAALLVLLCAGLADAAVTIQSVRLLDYKIDRTKAFVTSKGASNSCYGIFVLITASDSAGQEFTGLGDCLPRGTVTNETVNDAWAGAQVMARELIGKQLTADSSMNDVAQIRQWMQRLDLLANGQKLTTRRPPAAGRQLRATLCGFDEALLDLASQMHKLPLYELLGGAKRMDVSVSAMTFNADASADELADKTEETSESYGALRLKIGLDDEQDLEKLAIVARELNGKKGTEIWVDVNQAWKSSDASIAMLNRIGQALQKEKFEGRFICEQPTLESDIPALAKVTAAMRKADFGKVRIVVMADECMWTLADAKKLVELDAADLVNLKIQKSGGLLASKEIGDYLAAHAPGMGVYVGGVVATDITSWANLQLCYALPRLDYSTGCIPRRAYKVNVASVPVSYRTGKIMKNPDRPGLGTGLDFKKLENYVHRESTITSARPPN